MADAYEHCTISLESSSYSLIAKTLEDKGSQGWELCCFLSKEGWMGVNELLIFFKRKVDSQWHGGVR